MASWRKDPGISVIIWLKGWKLLHFDPRNKYLGIFGSSGACICKLFRTHKCCFLLSHKHIEAKVGIALVKWFLFRLFSSSQVCSGRMWETIYFGFNVSRTNKIWSEVSYCLDFLQLGTLHVIVVKDGTNRACRARKLYFCHGRNRIIVCASMLESLS